jgi:tRNA (mo5U34)-methyltransferase
VDGALSSSGEILDLHYEVERRAPWYHTFELPQGVLTDGYFDLRRVESLLPLPVSLQGKRCLDAAACEGFWSFALGKRGADEVVSLDLPDTAEQDWQGTDEGSERTVGTGLANDHFFFVRDALGVDNVERVDMNIYDASPQRLGSFDYVFVGNVLVHLADPARALRALRSVMRPGAELLSLEPNSLALSVVSPWLPAGQLWDWDDQARWWTPNRAAHRRFLTASGLDVVQQGRMLWQPFGAGMRSRPPRFSRHPRELLFWGVVRRFGVASGWVRAVRPPG